ncbi:RlpA-like double-psi beta-barrel-protein domain-containing protein-containing protein [Amanita rubescens]|nr:RlpA-like double-psi beta-barrel-protein domain-containing protein-containing protein [Amanita rubescens]
MFSRFLSLALIALSFGFGTFAHSNGHHNARHHELARRASSAVDIHSRFNVARWTFYAVGLGACGKVSQPSDFIVALNTPQFGGGYPGPNCFKQITMEYGGKTTTATILDECPGCPYGGLDLSIGLFTFFAAESVGVLYGTWFFSDGSGGGGGDPTTTHTHTWSPSPTPSPPPLIPSILNSPTPSPTTTWTPKPTSTSHSASSSGKPSSPMNNSTSVAVPTGTTTGSDQFGNINLLSLLIISLGDLVVAGQSTT